MAHSYTPTQRQQAIAKARTILQDNPVYLDTETTGLGSTDEIIEISIVNDDGSIILETLVKPSKPIPADASAIHGILDEEVKSAPTWPVIWQNVRSALFGRLIIIYNAEFDLRMLQQSHARYRLPWKERFNTFDMMKLYSEFRGEWDPKRRAYRFFSLDSAGKMSGITLPNAHRSTADCLLTRELLHYLAELED
jgi:DNA polymerase III subunit epsilon